MEQALSDVKILDLTHYIAGPYCTKLLADYGADVIKVEQPGIGDGARKMGPFPADNPHPEKSGLFLHLNTNKKGITLILKPEPGLTSLRNWSKTWMYWSRILSLGLWPLWVWTTRLWRR